jgi:hypothetical protein
MTLPSLEQVVTVINKVQNAIEMVRKNTHVKWTRSRPSTDLSQPQAISGVMGTDTGRTERSHGTRTEVYRERFRKGLGAPTTAE